MRTSSPRTTPIRRADRASLVLVALAMLATAGSACHDPSSMGADDDDAADEAYEAAKRECEAQDAMITCPGDLYRVAENLLEREPPAAMVLPVELDGGRFIAISPDGRRAPWVRFENELCWFACVPLCPHGPTCIADAGCAWCGLLADDISVDDCTEFIADVSAAGECVPGG